MAVIRVREDLHALRGTRAVEELAHPIHGQRRIVLGDEEDAADLQRHSTRERGWDDVRRWPRAAGGREGPDGANPVVAFRRGERGPSPEAVADDADAIGV